MKHLFNPIIKDFETEWLDDDNVAHTLKVQGMTLAEFPDYQYNFVRKHLADFVANERGYKPNAELMFKEIFMEIEVDE